MTKTRKLQVTFITTDARVIVRISLQLIGIAKTDYLHRSIAASIARLVLYVQLVQAALAMQAVDQNRTTAFASIPQARLTVLNRSTHVVHLFWSTLEVGLAVIAACLPALSSLFTATSLQSAVRSVRSILSLHSSHDSSKNSIRNPAIPYTDPEHNSSLSSRTGFVKPGVYADQTEYDMQDFELADQQKRADHP